LGGDHDVIQEPANSSATGEYTAEDKLSGGRVAVNRQIDTEALKIGRPVLTSIGSQCCDNLTIEQNFDFVFLQGRTAARRVL